MAGGRLTLKQLVEAVKGQLLWRFLGDSICRCNEALGRVMLTGSQPAGGIASQIGVVDMAGWQGMSLGAISCSAPINLNIVIMY